MAVYNFTARAIDSAGAFADRAFSITVNNTQVDKFVMCSQQNGMLTSYNGINWTYRGAYTSGIAYLNNQWVAVAGANSINTSSDTISWSPVTGISGMSASRTTAVADMVGYNGSYYLVGYQTGTGVTLYKSNTLSGAWTQAFVSGAVTNNNTEYLTSSLRWHSALNLWIMTLGHTQGGSFGGANGGIYTSPDGTTWTNRWNPGNSYYPICQAAANGLYLVGVTTTSGAGGGTASNGYIALSTDGINWASTSVLSIGGASICGITSLTYGNGVWVAGVRTNNDSRVYYSTTGRPGSWAQGSGFTIGSPDYSYPAYKCGAMFYNGQFVVMNSNGTGLVNASVDGINWTNPGTGSFSYVHKVVTIDNQGC